MTTNKPLEAVLEELVAEGAPTADNLNRWLQAYPQHRQDITEFVSEWQLQSRLPDQPRPIDAKALGAQVLEGLQQKLARRSSETFHGILAQAQKLGIRLERAADELGVNVRLLNMLDEKRVRADTVPAAFINALSARLEVSAEKFGGWLSAGSPPRRPIVVLGLTFRRPTVQPFEKAWRQSGLPVHDLEHWVSASKSARG